MREEDEKAVAALNSWGERKCQRKKEAKCLAMWGQAAKQHHLCQALPVTVQRCGLHAKCNALLLAINHHY